MKRLNLSYFDNELGPYDKFNPRFVFNNENAKKIINLLSVKPPYYYDKETLFGRIKCLSLNEYDNVIEMLENICAIDIKDDRLRMNFPFFNNSDVKTIKNIVNEELKENIEFYKGIFIELYKEVKRIYPLIDPKVTLYHLLCGKIFDGEFFNYLEKEGFLKTSYPKKDNRDYVIIGYENSRYCNKFNDNLICSFNNARFGNNSLSSFGTPSSGRVDYFRYFKIREKGKIGRKYLKLHRLFSNIDSSVIVENSINIIKDILNDKKVEDNNFVKGLIMAKYISNDYKLLVPVFENYVKNTKDLCDIAIRLLGSKIIDDLNKIKRKIINKKINSISHEVDLDEIFNEIWHIYFGTLNRYFVNMKFVEEPCKCFMQGEYLKCVYLD